MKNVQKITEKKAENAEEKWKAKEVREIEKNDVPTLCR
jgi:hypothetical protein